MTSALRSATAALQLLRRPGLTCRVEDGATFLQTYNAENRISTVEKHAGADCVNPGTYLASWSFGYDGDGTRTAQLYTPYSGGNPGTAVVSAYFFGGSLEVTGSTVKKYYSFAGQSIAMRDASGLQYFLTDHLGSMVAVLSSTGTLTSQQRYLPFGQVREDVGSITQTDFGYTGQRDNSYIKLLDYRSRWYDPELGRFISPDSIIPNPANPQSLNRYSYTLNNPIRYNDPSGHRACDDFDANGKCVIDKFGRLLDYVYEKILNDKGIVKKQYDALEAMNKIVKQAAYIYGSDWDGFFKATNYVFLGTSSNSPYTMAVAHFSQGFHGIAFSSGSGDTGFNQDFEQAGDNQVRHFWAAFATAANGVDPGRRGEINAQYGNFLHDVVEDWMGHDDTTYSDYTLSVVAIDLAEQVNAGSIASPSALPGAFDATLGVNSPGYTGANLQWLFSTPNQ